MSTIEHLWNVSKFFEKMLNPEVAKLRMHYVQCCREMSDKVELPKQNFGAAVMCPQCGSPWASTKHKTRITSAKKPSRQIERLVRASRGGSDLSKCRQSLINKYEKKRANKMIKICSVCSEVAKFALAKPQRRKLEKPKKLSNTLDVTISSKKKKKRVKDRTAGLNVSGIKTPDVKRNSDDGDKIKVNYQTPLVTNKKTNLNKLNKQTLVSKPTKINLSKLKGIIDTTTTPSKKSKLHTFLQLL